MSLHSKEPLATNSDESERAATGDRASTASTSAHRFQRVLTSQKVKGILDEIDDAKDWSFSDRHRKIPCQRHTNAISIRSEVPVPGLIPEDNHRSTPSARASKFPHALQFLDQAAATFGGTLGRAMIVRLAPSSKVYPHIDHGAYYAIRDRYHLVLASEGSEMVVEDETCLWHQAELWWFNNRLQHSAFNRSSADWRIHLIFDLLPDSGLTRERMLARNGEERANLVAVGRTSGNPALDVQLPHTPDSLSDQSRITKRHPDDLRAVGSKTLPEASSLELDAVRICPVLISSAMIDGSRLTVRSNGEELVVNARPEFLQRLFVWCDGSTALYDIDQRCRDDGPQLKAFPRFLRAMLAEGILIDAAQRWFLERGIHQLPNSHGKINAQGEWRAANLPASRFVTAEQKLQGGPPGFLLNLLAGRSSCRAFENESISEAALVALLTAAYGVTNHDGRRSVASAGAIYGLQCSLILCRPIGAWAPAIYQVLYGPNGSVGLKKTGALDEESLVRACVQPKRLFNVSAIVIVAGDAPRVSLKYRNRSMPYLFLEAGMVQQNLVLAAIENGVGHLVFGGFEEARLEAMLGLSNLAVLSTCLVGVPADDPATETPFEFGWSEALPDAPFILAQARLTQAGAQRPFAWGRDELPSVAHDKAMAEAHERFAIEQAQQLTTHRYLHLPRALHPDTLIGYEAEQFDQGGFRFDRFQPNMPRLWTTINNGFDASEALIAAEFVFTRRSLPSDYRPLTAATSSGVAAHVTSSQALEHATAELIERDAFMRHWLSQTAGRGASLDSLPAAIQASLAPLQKAGCVVWVSMLTLGLAPTWMVILQHQDRHFTTVGSACSANHEAAIRSAFMEAETAARVWLANSQARPLDIRDVMDPSDHLHLYAQQEYFQKADALIPASNVSLEHLLETSDGSFNSAVETVRRANLQLWFKDLTVPNGPLSLAGQSYRTVRAVVPGLLPLAFGLELPFGMVDSVAAGSRFPTPLA